MFMTSLSIRVGTRKVKSWDTEVHPHNYIVHWIYRRIGSAQ